MEHLSDDSIVGEAGGWVGIYGLSLSDSLGPPTCTGDLVLLQNLVVSAGTHSSSGDGEAEGTAAPVIHAACVVTWRNPKTKLGVLHF